MGGVSTDHLLCIGRGYKVNNFVAPNPAYFPMPVANSDRPSIMWVDQLLCHHQQWSSS